MARRSRIRCQMSDIFNGQRHGIGHRQGKVPRVATPAMVAQFGHGGDARRQAAPVIAASGLPQTGAAVGFSCRVCHQTRRAEGTARPVAMHARLDDLPHRQFQFAQCIPLACHPINARLGQRKRVRIADQRRIRCNCAPDCGKPVTIRRRLKLLLTKASRSSTSSKGTVAETGRHLWRGCGCGSGARLSGCVKRS